MNLLYDTVSSIQPVDHRLQPQIQAHLDNLTKPPGSLGELERIAMNYCLITQTVNPVLTGKRIYTFAADNGVVAEGITCYPPEVTAQMVLNMLAGGAAVNVLGRHAGAETCVVDVGVNADLGNPEGLIGRKVRYGTDNIAHGPAMSEPEAIRAIEVGIALAAEAHRDGISLLGTGEMGIGNTTTSSALFAHFLGCDVESVTGRGAGISDDLLARKTTVIKQALQVNKERLTSPVSALAAVGGLDIAAIAGLCLGAAANRIPVVVDGFISSAGALVACQLAPAVKGYLFFSHLSKEQGHAVVMQQMQARPILDLEMRLGEGTGAALAMIIIEAAIRMYTEMATFDSAGVTGERTE